MRGCLKIVNSNGPERTKLMQTMLETVGAGPVAAEWAGEGQPVVFLHADVADRRMWRHQFDTLAATHRVIAFDRRGFGETAMVDETYSQTDDLFTVLDRLAGRDKPVILVGCLRGGGIAIDAALALPDRVAALVLIAPGVSGWPSPTPIECVQRLRDAIELARTSGDLDEVIRWQTALWLDGPLSDEGRVSGPARTLFRAMNRIALATPRLGRAVEPEPAWGRLDQITVPVRILCGDLDIPHIRTRCEQLAAALLDSRLEILSGAAHLPSLEQPERITKRLLALLADCQQARQRQGLVMGPQSGC